MDHGTLEHDAEGRPRLRFTRRLPHPPAKVWRAITEPEHLAAWFPDTVVVEHWEPGAPLRFEGAPVDGGSFEGEVLAFEPPHALELRWGTDVLRLEVRPDGDGTRLTLLDTLNAVGKAARDGAGWHICLDDLAYHLAGAVAPASATDRWRAVHPAYVASLGPEAATVGPPAGAPG
jgi:uncharacterized protein YndB with AHSA1/START domain